MEVDSNLKGEEGGDKNLKVSVIVPVYNAEIYINKCLETIINQTYKNIEIIMVDDGSKDNSLNILNSFECKDNRIKVLSQENSGPSKARNRGIEESTGEYIAFIDADDYINENYIQKMIYSINGSDLVVCNFIEYSNMGRNNVGIFKCVKESTSIDNLDIIREIILGLGGLVWGKLFKKEIITKNIIRFNETFNMSEDLLFVIEFINYANDIKRVDEYLYYYNKINVNSITHNYNYRLFLKQIELQYKIKEVLSKRKFNIKDINNTVDERLKDIVMYSIYKEVINNKYYNAIKNIKLITMNENVLRNCDKFIKKGPIDRLLVSAIVNRNIRTIYLLTKLRINLLYLYNKLK